MLVASPSDQRWFGHPRGLTVLFMTETAAYFSAYGLQALLVLYITRHLAQPQANASAIFGLYTAAANLTPLLGGYIADRYLGNTRSVVLGGTLMALGHLAMVWESQMWTGLALVAFGNGFFITSLASQIGSLYSVADPRRDQGFIIYYLGINVGAFLAPITCGWLAQAYGWHYGFAAAALVMAAGLVVYLTMLPLIRPVSFVASADTSGKVAAAATPRDRLRVLALVLGLVILFRLGYEQTGNTIAIWIDRHTVRMVGNMSIPAAWFQSLNPLLIFLFAPLLSAFWNRRAGDALTATLRKLKIGCALAAIAYVVMIGASIEWERHGHASMLWALGFFLFMTLAELHVLPVGLSLFARLSPAAHASLMIGIWYGAKFIASLTAGAFGTLWEALGPMLFFGINVAVAVAAMMLTHVVGRKHLVRQLAESA